MTKLTRNEVRFKWNDSCEKAFQELGQRYTVYCDASKDGLGYVLMQSRKVVAYDSR